MKALILAAGKGVRMLPLTADKPKTLVMINGKPFLWYIFQNLKKVGFTEIAIVAGYKIEKIVEFLQEYELKAMVLEQSQLLGTGNAVQQAQTFCAQEQFIVLGGDNLFSPTDLKAISKKDSFCYIAGKEKKNPEKKYGILIAEGNRLIRIAEKPKEFMGNLINTGLYKFTPEIFTALEQIKLSERGEYELTDAVSLIATEGKARIYLLKDYWLDLGCREDIPTIEAFLKYRRIK